MARSIRCETLTQLQAQMTRLETAIEPQDVKPILAKALEPIKTKALQNLRALPGVVLGGPLRLPGQRHIEEELFIEEGRSNRLATAFCKVWRKFAPQGVWLEWGHVIWRGGRRKQGKGKQLGHSPARPWYRPAVASERKTSEAIVETGLRQLIQRFTTKY